MPRSHFGLLLTVAFRPYNNTTRGQLSKIVALAEGWSIDITGGPHFTDVPWSNPFYAYIETAYHHGVISGYSDGTFRWGNEVTRGQLAKIITVAQNWSKTPRAAPTSQSTHLPNPFYAYIETAYNHGVISGYSDGTFRRGNSATRGQISKIVQQRRSHLPRNRGAGVSLPAFKGRFPSQPLPGRIRHPGPCSSREGKEYLFAEHRRLSLLFSA